MNLVAKHLWEVKGEVLGLKDLVNQLIQNISPAEGPRQPVSL